MNRRSPSGPPNTQFAVSSGTGSRPSRWPSGVRTWIPFFAVVGGPIAALNFQDAAVRYLGATPRPTIARQQWAIGGRLLTLMGSLVLIALAWPEGETIQTTALAGPFDDRVRGFLMTLFQSDRLIVAHNAVFDVRQLSKLIDILKQEGITEVVMCGQVKHAKIFSSIRPDWRLAKLLASLPSKNTGGLIGGVIRILEDEGIHLRESTFLLKPLLAAAGALTKRKPDKDELADIEYGRRVANALAGFDVGQSVAVKERAVLAVEAIEGTDQAILRAGALSRRKGFVVVKVAKPRQDMRFDVPTVGVWTIDAMHKAGGRVLAIEAGRTILLDPPETIALADRYGIIIKAL